MQNKKLSSEITRAFKYNYQRFQSFLTAQTHYNQMPKFQIEYFLNRATYKNSLITITFIDQTITGYIHQLSSGKYVISPKNENLSQIILFDYIKTIKVN